MPSNNDTCMYQHIFCPLNKFLIPEKENSTTECAEACSFHHCCEVEISGRFFRDFRAFYSGYQTLSFSFLGESGSQGKEIHESFSK